MSAQHTPGPWVSDGAEVWADGPRRINCAEAGTPRVCVVDDHQAEDFNAKATARLIAAAPDLLAALEDAIEAVRTFHGQEAWDIYWQHSPECKRWRAAIAAARGQA